MTVVVISLYLHVLILYVAVLRFSSFLLTFHSVSILSLTSNGYSKWQKWRWRVPPVSHRLDPLWTFSHGAACRIYAETSHAHACLCSLAVHATIFVLESCPALGACLFFSALRTYKHSQSRTPDGCDCTRSIVVWHIADVIDLHQHAMNACLPCTEQVS